ncbi:ThiF family adenylyltransferase [Thalassobellus citreus]|uniref:ThiF family adenylyltransferase n=1 Tax=Thalassobellus citreus TaxID=3367752 RepID=UPI0037A9DC03
MQSKIGNNILDSFSKEIEDNVSLIPNKDANFILNNQYEEIWKIETGLYDDENGNWLVEELNVYIAFSKEFPLVPPKIYFDHNHFPKIGYIPHITYVSCNVCVFDEFVIVDETKPAEIILFQYKKARQTLIDGIKGINDADFDDEFIAYWETYQNKKDSVSSRNYLTLIKNEPKSDNELQVLFYRKKEKRKGQYKAIIFNKNETQIKPYEAFLEKHDYEKVIIDVFYLGEIDTIDKPSFYMDCESSLIHVPIDKKTSFKHFFNNEEHFRIVVFRKELKGIVYYLGWEYPSVKTKVNGFKGNKVSIYDATFKKILPTHKKSVKRFPSESIDLDRLIKRTSSEHLKNIKKNFLLAGIGSVGSNLLINLNNFNFPNFTLVDDDSLSTENIGRHIFGFKDIDRKKVEIAEEFLKSRLPSQKVSALDNSVYDLFNENSDLFNQQDYIFLCIGKQNLEKWFINQLISGKLKKPVFIIWVEPYLLGGQCLFLHPDIKLNINDLFFDVFKYKYSIIESEELELKRDLFTLKESGCQSTFSPYSSSHLSVFLSSIYPKIFQIIENNSIQNKAFSWIGDTEIAKELDVKLNYDEDMKYSLIENTI